MVGMANLEAATERSFFSWYSDFVSTVALDGTNQQFGPRFEFLPEVMDPFTKLKRNIRMRSSRENEIGAPLTLSGLTDYQQAPEGTASQLTGSLFSSGTNAYLIRVPASHELTISITGDPKLFMGLTIVPAL
jgi:hypothetical protein